MEDRFMFKAWNKKRKEMSDPFGFGEHAFFPRKMNCGSLSTNNFLGMDIIQCTGLKDKNSKLIYEGDILKTCNSDPAFDIWKDTDFGLTVVEWDSEYAEWNYSNWSIEIGMSSIYGLDFVQVIGNIHENPKLLEK